MASPSLYQIFTKTFSPRIDTLPWEKVLVGCAINPTSPIVSWVKKLYKSLADEHSLSAKSNPVPVSFNNMDFESAEEVPSKFSDISKAKRVIKVFMIIRF